MAYFPIFTQIEGKRCLIIGGGKVAARKVHTLLRYEAEVVVVAEKVCEEIKESLPEEYVFEYSFEHVFKYIHEDEFENIFEMSADFDLDLKMDSDKQKDLSVERNRRDLIRTYRNTSKTHRNTFLEKEIQKSFLVIAATSSRKINHRVAELCHQYRTLVNVADSEKESTFIFPSVVRKGDISIGINSGTGSPAVSKQIRKQIERAVPDYYADIAVFMGELRQYVKANFKEEAQRRYILKTAAARAFVEERTLTEKEIEEIIRQGQR